MIDDGIPTPHVRRVDDQEPDGWVERLRVWRVAAFEDADRRYIEALLWGDRDEAERQYETRTALAKFVGER